MRVLQEANPIWRLASYGLALAAVAMTLLLIYLLHGRARLAQFAFPVAFFLVAVPWPTPLEGVAIQSLTRFNSSLVMELLGFAGIPALLHGNVIEISTGLVGIDEACSGIRSLQATLMIALFFGAFYRLPWARRGWLLVAGPALAMAFNLARTLTLVLVASHAGLPAMEKWHDPTGVALLLGCFFSLWAVALFLARGKGQGTQAKGQRSEVGGQKPEDKGQRPEVGSPISRRAEAQAEVGRSPLSSINSPLSAPCAVAASRESAADSALAAPKPSAGGPLSSPHPVVSSPVVSSPVVSSPVVSSLVFLYALTVALSTEAWFRSHEARGSQAVSWAAQWPTANASLQTNIIPPLALRELLCDQHASANWSDDTGVFWQAFYLRWLPADTFYGRARVAMSKGHNPAICLTGAGMTLQTRLEPVSLPVDPGLSLTFDRFVFTAGGRDLFVFFSQTEDLTDGGQANLRMTHLARLRAALTGSRNYGERNLEVALAGPASPAAALALFQARLPDLIEVKQP
jgi:exosortase